MKNAIKPEVMTLQKATALLMLILLSILLACSVPESELSPEKKEEVTREVLAAFDKLVKAARDLDEEAYLENIDTNSFSGVYSGGVVFENTEEFTTFYRHSISDIRSYIELQFDQVKVTVLRQDIAILVNHYSATVMLKSGEKVSGSGVGTQVWQKAEGVWKLVSISGS